MRKLLFGLLLIHSCFVYSQKKNRFDFTLGGNYPINLSEENLGRKTGINLNFDYNRIIYKNLVVETGIAAYYYEVIDWNDKIRLDLNVPVKVGYKFSNLELLSGFYFCYHLYQKGFYSIDPETLLMGKNDGNYYYDLHGYDNFLNYLIECKYQMYKDLYLYTELKLIQHKTDLYLYSLPEEKHYYSLISIGVTIRL